MIKKTIIILSMLVIIGGIIPKSAVAGPPWPAEVVQIREGDLCYFSWLDETFTPITLTGPGMWVVQYVNGRAQWNCHTVIDFEDPNIASLDEVCWYFEEYLGFSDYCKGNGSFIWTTASQPVPLDCYHLDGVTQAYRATWVTTANGNTNISCLFDYTP